jgi:RNA polymerase sigma factor (sigma-70 family)
MSADETPWDQLLVRLKRSPSDSAAWDELCKRVRCYARAALDGWSGLGPESADDLSQQMLVKLLESEDGLSLLDEDRSPGAYLKTAIRNAATDIARRRVLAVRVLKDLAEWRFRVAGGQSSDFGNRTWVHSQLALLPEHDQRLLRMRYWEDRDISEIAATLQMNRSTVAVRLYRIIEELRRRATHTDTV